MADAAESNSGNRWISSFSKTKLLITFSVSVLQKTTFPDRSPLTTRLYTGSTKTERITSACSKETLRLIFRHGIPDFHCFRR